MGSSLLDWSVYVSRLKLDVLVFVLHHWFLALPGPSIPKCWCMHEDKELEEEPELATEVLSPII
ncbi:Hypothetical protein PHPALM_3682 [Phytophthora palmivora]|uniref:Uncharacterized protein n=1 Tax=Phytophthora palmivora TaxID=4796 RepID=A0A2P4YLS6_9STRA|nr:Hypothetical protein PHPALM_3682 [Phytophthora palmivora]